MADPTDHPLFDKAAEQMSKNYIFLFMCTSVALMIFSDARPGWLYGIGFLVVGMFAVSVIVALPMFWIRFQILPARIKDMPIERKRSANPIRPHRGLSVSGRMFCGSSASI